MKAVLLRLGRSTSQPLLITKEIKMPFLPLLSFPYIPFLTLPSLYFSSPYIATIFPVVVGGMLGANTPSTFPEAGHVLFPDVLQIHIIQMPSTLLSDLPISYFLSCGHHSTR